MSTYLGLWRQFVYLFSNCGWLYHGCVLYAVTTNHSLCSVFNSHKTQDVAYSYLPQYIVYVVLSAAAE
jgi:hypothetical protein